MKIEAKMITLHCFEKIRFCMIYIAKNGLCPNTYCTLMISYLKGGGDVFKNYFFFSVGQTSTSRLQSNNYDTMRKVLSQ